MLNNVYIRCSTILFSFYIFGKTDSENVKSDPILAHRTKFCQGWYSLITIRCNITYGSELTVLSSRFDLDLEISVTGRNLKSDAGDESLESTARKGSKSKSKSASGSGSASVDISVSVSMESVELETLIVTNETFLVLAQNMVRISCLQVSPGKDQNLSVK